MSKITEQFIDKAIAEIGQSGKPYYYNFPLGFDIDRKARIIMKAVNNFLKLYQRITGKTISSLEQLKQLLEQGTNLWNSESLFDATVRSKEELKEEQEFGMKRDKPLPFFGVDLTNAKTVELFLAALQPLYKNWNSKRTVLNQFGFASIVYDLKPIDIDANKFALQGNELVTTDAHAEARDTKCKRYATTPEQIARVKIAMDFIKPFREMEKHILDKQVVSTKSYIRNLGLPYPVCITWISDERKELQPNPEFVEGIKVEQPKYDSLASKVLSQGKYEKA